MKNYKKVTAVVLSAAMMMSSSAMVFAIDKTEGGKEVLPISQEQTLSKFQFGLGVIKEITNENNIFRIVFDTDIKDDMDIALNISDETIFMDNETGLPVSPDTLKVGDKICAYYSSAMTRSIPPQSSAIAIMTNITEGKSSAIFIEVKEVIKNDDGSIKVSSEDGFYEITILPENPISPFKTKQIVTVDDIVVGSRIFTWFDIMTLSYPAQATSNKTVVLPAVAPVSDTEETEKPADTDKIEETDKPVSGISIDGTAIDLGGHSIFEQNNNHMVPLRLVSETLGFTVSWDDKTSTVSLDDGTVNTNVTVGIDSYYKASTKALGLTAPYEFGAAPVNVDGTIYVPVQLFSLLYSNPETVTTADGIISIKSK